MVKKKTKYQPKYKLKIIVSLSVLLSVLLLFSIIVISIMLNSLITKQIVENGQNTSAQLQSSVEQILEVMNNSLIQMSLDTDLQSFFDRLEFLDIFDREEVYKRLRRAKSSSSSDSASPLRRY